MSRSSSNSSSTDGSNNSSNGKGTGSAGSNGSSSSSSKGGSPGGGSNAAADVWAAANSSSGLFEYEDDPLGPEFMAVTTFNADGKTTTTYIKQDAAGLQHSSSSSSSRGSGNGQPVWRSSSNPMLQPPQRLVPPEECPAEWQVSGLHSDCRPVYDDATALQAALVNIVWSFAMLGHCHSSMAKECFKALALVLPEAFSDEQLTMLWASHMR
jgi:hypothetical protein